MSYLLDKKNQRKKNLKIISVIFFLLILFYWRTPIYEGLSAAAQLVFTPVLILGNQIAAKFQGISYFLSFRNTLIIQNENFKRELESMKIQNLDRDLLFLENANLKKILGRKGDRDLVLAAVLSKPNQSPFDTLLIDVGLENGIKKGDLVFALGSIPIGRVDSVYANSAKVVLFSASEEKNTALVSSQNLFMELLGRGGGNFELILPRDFILAKGDLATLPGLGSYPLAIVETVISDPRDSFQKALLVSPVNVQELKFVQVAI